MVFIIDGIDFTNDIKVVSLNRSAHFFDKYAKRNIKGELSRELIGVYINYKLKIDMLDNMSRYHQLWDILTKPIPFHTIVMPTDEQGQSYTFTAYVADVKDNGLKIVEGHKPLFHGLEVEFIAKNPFRRPS